MPRNRDRGLIDAASLLLTFTPSVAELLIDSKADYHAKRSSPRQVDFAFLRFAEFPKRLD
jgi:hypothetical protein